MKTKNPNEKITTNQIFYFKKQKNIQHMPFKEHWTAAPKLIHTTIVF